MKKLLQKKKRRKDSSKQMNPEAITPEKNKDESPASADTGFVFPGSEGESGQTLRDRRASSPRAAPSPRRAATTVNDKKNEEPTRTLSHASGNRTESNDRLSRSVASPVRRASSSHERVHRSVEQEINTQTTISDLENGGRMSDLLDPQTRKRREEELARRRHLRNQADASYAGIETDPDLGEAEDDTDLPKSAAEESKLNETAADNPNEEKKTETDQADKSSTVTSEMDEDKKEDDRSEGDEPRTGLARLIRMPGFWCMFITIGFIAWMMLSMLHLGLLKFSLAMLIFGIGLTGLAIAGFWFFMTRSKLWTIPGILLCVALVLGCVAGESYVHSISNGIASLCASTEEYTMKSGLYVPNAVPLQSLQALEGQTVGILGSRSQAANEKVMSELNSQGVHFTTRSFSTLQQLYKAVRGQSVRAAILTPSDVRMIHEFSSGEQTSAGLTSEFSTTWNTGIQPNGSSINIESDPYTVLLCGSRTQVGETSFSSTLNLLLTVNPKENEILVTVVPRAMAVASACSDALGCPEDEAQDRVGLLSYNTIEAEREALEKALDTKIDFTVHIDLNTFSQIFDVVYGLYESGGQHYSLSAPLSENEELAMSSPKIRQILGTLSSFSGSDFDLELNQLVMLTDISQSLRQITPGNLSKIFKILDASVSTSFDYEQMCTLIREFVLLPEPVHVDYSVISGSYETEYSPLLTESTYMMVPDQASLDKAKAAIQAVLSGQKPDVSGIETGKSITPTPADPDAQSPDENDASDVEGASDTENPDAVPEEDVLTDPNLDLYGAQ